MWHFPTVQSLAMCKNATMPTNVQYSFHIGVWDPQVGGTDLFYDLVVPPWVGGSWDDINRLFKFPINEDLASGSWLVTGWRGWKYLSTDSYEFGITRDVGFLHKNMFLWRHHWSCSNALIFILLRKYYCGLKLFALASPTPGGNYLVKTSERALRCCPAAISLSRP
jgi:hypothetical protein